MSFFQNLDVLASLTRCPSCGPTSTPVYLMQSGSRNAVFLLLQDRRCKRSTSSMVSPALYIFNLYFKASVFIFYNCMYWTGTGHWLLLYTCVQLLWSVVCTEMFNVYEGPRWDGTCTKTIHIHIAVKVSFMLNWKVLIFSQMCFPCVHSMKSGMLWDNEL